MLNMMIRHFSDASELKKTREFLYLHYPTYIIPPLEDSPILLDTFFIIIYGISRRLVLPTRRYRSSEIPFQPCFGACYKFHTVEIYLCVSKRRKGIII